MMAVAHAGWEADAVAGAEPRLAVVAHEDDFAVEDVNEFVLVRVPVALARPRAGREAQLVHAELRQARGGAEAHALAVLARLVEWRRIEAAFSRRRRRSINLLGHVVQRSRATVRAAT